jgi:hypothetical protein
MEWLGWGLATFFAWLSLRYIKKYRISNRRQTDLNFRQQRLFKEIQTQKDEKAIVEESLAQAQDQIKYMNRQTRDKRRIQV